MDSYPLLKTIHVLAAVVALGSNVTYAFWLGRAGRDRDRLVYTINGIRALDRRLANPAYVVLLLSGVGLVAVGAWSFSARWLELAVGLYVATALLGVLVFAPALRRQLVEAERDPAAAPYELAARRTRLLGILTTAIVVLIVALMVTKPF